MPAYLVRIIGTRDLVGIFTADDGLGLAIAVDECTDVSDCEYAELPYGGIMWESPAKPVPLNVGDTDGSMTEISGPGVQPGLKVITGQLTAVAAR